MDVDKEILLLTCPVYGEKVSEPDIFILNAGINTIDNAGTFDFFKDQKAVDRMISFLSRNGKTLFYTPLSAVFYYAVRVLLFIFPALYTGSSKK